jgi:hypothetical protein
MSVNNVTLRFFLTTIIAVENQLILRLLSVCVCVALGTQHAIRMRHIVICGVSGPTLFFHIISQKARFFFKKKCIIINIKGWASWPVPSPQLQLLSPTFLRSPNRSLSCGLSRYDFEGIRFCGILCRCESQFLLYSSILSNMHSVCSSRRMESFLLWSLRCGLPEASIISFLPPQFFVSVRLSIKKLLNIKCVFRVSQQILPKTLFILRRTEQLMIENV